MAMVKPIALNLSSFDATEEHIFYFTANGGDQVVKNKIEIYDNITNALVFSQTQTTFKFENVVPLNSLTNDTTYYYRIKTYDVSNNESEWSNQIQFTCYAKATIIFQNISTITTVNASSYEFEMHYSQSEGEKLNSYIVDLYDSNNLLISSSGTKYIGEYVGNDAYFTYTFSGFADGETYKIECRCISQYGAEVTTDKISFFVDYFYPNVFSLFATTNNPTDGRIDLDVNVRVIDGESNPTPPIYIDDTLIDLRNSGYYVKWDDKYTVPSNMTLRLFFFSNTNLTDFDENLICMISNSEDLEANKNRIEVRYIQEWSVNTETMRMKIEVLCYNKTSLAYTLYSNEIDAPTKEQGLIAFIRKKNNVFSIVLDTVEGDMTIDYLDGKKILLAGDSLMYGNGWLGGFGNVIAEQHPTATIINVAQSGAKLQGGEIFQQIVGHYTSGGDIPDVILVDGGGNDFINRVAMGTASLSASFPTNTNATTADAMDELIYYTKSVYPNVKIIFMTLPPMMQWGDGSVVPGVPIPSLQKEYFDEIKKVCEKYGVSVIDLFHDANITSMIPSQLAQFYMTDDVIHLNQAGYRKVAPIVEAGLRKAN